MPRLDASEEEEESPPGLDGTDGRDPAPAEEPAAVVRVAMAVGNTKDGSELPAKPIFVYPVPLSRTMTLERDMLASLCWVVVAAECSYVWSRGGVKWPSVKRGCEGSSS